MRKNIIFNAIDANADFATQDAMLTGAKRNGFGVLCAEYTESLRHLVTQLFSARSRANRWRRHSVRPGNSMLARQSMAIGPMQSMIQPESCIHPCVRPVNPGVKQCVVSGMPSLVTN